MRDAGSGTRDHGSEDRDSRSDDRIGQVQQPGPAVPDPGSPIPAAATSDSPQSAALVRFRSCRWMQPAEDGNVAFCTHREVKPYAGSAGFDAEAWCPECQHYKLRRAPRKRTPDEPYGY